MFFKKKFKKKYVECEECGVLVNREMAYAVVVKNYFGGRTDYYCSVHQKPYDKVLALATDTWFYREVEVDINGEPIDSFKPKRSNTCDICGKTLKTLRGMRIHRTRVH